jgi:hypothetical protein
MGGGGGVQVFVGRHVVATEASQVGITSPQNTFHCLQEMGRSASL